MNTLRAFQVDAFTNRMFAGNPASVVLDADCLSDKQMQSIAREFNNSETAFLLNPDAEDHDIKIRYFTPTIEVPTCGHATISAHYVRAKLGLAPPGTQWHKIGIGRLPVEITKVDADFAITMTQGSPEFSPIFDKAKTDLVLQALGVGHANYDSRFPIQHVNTGNSKILVGLNSRETLDSLEPDRAALLALDREFPNRGVYAFCVNSPVSGITAHARMFAPQIGINEDPVTGNGAGPLGAYLAHHSFLRASNGSVRLRVKQGERLRRPGIVDVDVNTTEGKVTGVRITGRAVIVFETTLTV